MIALLVAAAYVIGYFVTVYLVIDTFFTSPKPNCVQVNQDVETFLPYLLAIAWPVGLPILFVYRATSKRKSAAEVSYSKSIADMNDKINELSEAIDRRESDTRQATENGKKLKFSGIKMWE